MKAIPISIYIVIADNFVNDNFGDNMIGLQPVDVKPRFFHSLVWKFPVTIGEQAGIYEIFRLFRTLGMGAL